MNESRSPERWIIGALLAVGLLTFFFPLASVQIPILGNLSLSGYDLFSKVRSLNRELTNIASKQEENPTLDGNPAEPQSPTPTPSTELPFSVRTIALVPAEIIVSFGFIFFALICCIGPFGPGSLRATSTVGALTAVAAVLHIVIANSDLHSWFLEQMRSNSAELAGNPFAAFAQGVTTAISNSFHLAPGPGLFALAGSATFSMVLAHSRILSRASSQDEGLESEANNGRGPARLFAFIAVAAVVIVLAVTVLNHQASEAPARNLPTQSQVTANPHAAAKEIVADQSSVGQASRTSVVGNIGSDKITSSLRNQGFLTYTNGRFGFRIDYPQTFVSREPPENGDGIELISNDGSASLVASGSNNPGRDISTVLRTAVESVKGPVEYQKMGTNWFVITWREGDKLTYQKTFLGEGSQNSLEFVYPAAQKADYDQVVTSIEKSFTPGDLEHSQ